MFQCVSVFAKQPSCLQLGVNGYGDIITAINGTKVRNSSDLYKVLDKAMLSTFCPFCRHHLV
jgi:hypothetical protein